jgi:chromosome segregation ATPase
MGSAQDPGDLRGSFMRVYAEVEDQINEELDQAAISEGSNKKLIVAKAIDLYLHQDRSSEDLLRSERDLLRSELDKTKVELDQVKAEGDLLRSQLDQLGSERDLLRSERDQLRPERDLLRSEQDKRWREIQQTRSELNQARRELEAARSLADQMRSERDQARSLQDQVSGEAAILKRDLEHYRDTLRLKDDEISFLRGHISQISEKITPALPPSQEEIRKKGWWQFWK